MDERKQAELSPPPVGGASLLVVFAVLCLTVFALLSLSTVRANQRLSEASAQAAADYYAADCQAQAVLAWLRTGEAEPGAIPEDFQISTSISDYPYPDRSKTIHYYACPISDTQELQVEIRMDGDGSYTILRWQAVPVGGWEESGVEIWDGEIF